MARVFMTNGGGSGGGAGGIETIANIGNGTGFIYAGGTNPANLRELKEGTDIGIATIGNDIVISFDGTIPAAATAENVGAGDEVYVTGSDNPFNFRTLTAGTDITLTQSADEIEIAFSGTIPAAATAQNIGTGEEVYVTGSDTPFDFRTLVAGTDIGITQNANDLTIDFTGTIPAAATAQNLGTGEEIYVTGSANPFDFKTLIAGTNITLTQTATDITIDASGGGGGGGNLQVKAGVPLDATLRAIADSPADTSSEIKISTIQTTIDGMTIGRGLNKQVTNSGVGFGVLDNTTTASENTAIGYYSLVSLVGGDGNTAVGYASGGGIVDGTANVCIGFESGTSLNNGSSNVAVGYQALANAIDVVDSVAIGFQALNGASVGTGNTAVGFQAGLVVESNDNTLVGYSAGSQITTGSGNTLIGKSAGTSIVGGSDNVAIGRNTLDSCTSGLNNIAIGTNAATAISTGQRNIAIGVNTLSALTNSTDNIAIGENSLASNNGTQNIGIGYGALQGSGGGYNVAMGYQALSAAGNNNVGIGYGAGQVSGASVEGCVFVGIQSGNSNQVSYNTCIGYRAGVNVTTGARNVFVGKGTDGNPTGNDNTIIGCDISSLGTNNNIVIGNNNNGGGFNSLLMLGIGDTATANGQARFGSLASPVGSINAGAATSTQAWRVFINGIQRDIMLR